MYIHNVVILVCFFMFIFMYIHTHGHCTVCVHVNVHVHVHCVPTHLPIHVHVYTSVSFHVQEFLLCVHCTTVVQRIRSAPSPSVFVLQEGQSAHTYANKSLGWGHWLMYTNLASLILSPVASLSRPVTHNAWWNYNIHMYIYMYIYMLLMYTCTCTFTEIGDLLYYRIRIPEHMYIHGGSWCIHIHNIILCWFHFVHCACTCTYIHSGNCLWLVAKSGKESGNFVLHVHVHVHMHACVHVPGS